MTLRSAYLSDVLRLLYPAAGRGERGLLVVPHTREPRLLVPAGARRAAATAVRYCTEPQSRGQRVVRGAAAVALRCGLGRLLLPRVRVAMGGSVEEHLSGLLGEPVRLAIHIGPARANRKPVAQVLSASGRVIGYLKLGTGRLTRRLVRDETAALTALSHVGLRHVDAPTVRHAGPWREHLLLVQSPLPVWRRRAPLRPERLVAAMQEVAYCCGVSRGPLSTSPYAKRLTERVGEIASHPEGAVLAAATGTLLARAGELELTYGAWHGDWAPWNMAVLPDRLLLWDWERFTTGVPIGFDAVHHHLQRGLRSTPDAAVVVAGTVADADQLLGPFGVPAVARRPTALLYLADLAARYLTDRQAEAGARLGILGSWLLPVLTHHLENLA